MRYLYLVLCAALVSSCSHDVQMMPAAGGSLNPSTRLSGSAPEITKVSRIKDKQYQKIVISGSGFGTMQRYNGDSDYLQILDTTGGWSAGYTSTSQYDSVWLDVKSWSDKRIVITGFTGDYGESYWILMKGDKLQINVWNPQTHDGPGTIDAKAK